MYMLNMFRMRLNVQMFHTGHVICDFDSSEKN